MVAYRIERTGMIIAGLLAFAMCLLSFILQPEKPIPGQPGLCLPPPSQWELPRFLSWFINTCTIGVCAIALWMLNRTYNFIRTTQPVLPALFLIFVASNPWITAELSTSVILCAVNVLALWILYGCYNLRNATQQMFLVATFLSIGSMFQYAFLPMILVYIIASVILKISRPKELTAFIFGLIAPYWITIGFGWINPDSFKMPAPTSLFSGLYNPADLFILMVSVGSAIFLGIAFGIPSLLKTYAGNSQVNAMNSVIAWLGIISMLCILIDFNNVMAYLATLFLAVAAQLANTCALWHFRHEWLVTFLPGLLFLFFFVFLTFL